MKHLKLIPFLTLFLATFISCSDDDPEVINESEVITKMTVTLVPQGGDVAVAKNTITLEVVDTDGPDGPNAPTFDVSGNLATNTTYNGSIVLLDESDPDNVEDITEEVEAEDLEHQFFYQVSNGLGITTAYSNFDADGNPLGTQFTLTTTSAGSGTITCTLIHEGNKFAEGVAEGNPANAGGETDISAPFNITVGPGTIVSVK